VATIKSVRDHYVAVDEEGNVLGVVAHMRMSAYDYWEATRLCDCKGDDIRNVHIQYALATAAKWKR